MAYRIEINGIISIIENGVWKSSDKNYEEFLNNWLKLEKIGAISPDSPYFWLNSPSTPDSDYLIATETAKDLDGTVLDEPLPTPIDEESIDEEEVDESEIIY